MSLSTIVYGPMACGKTRNADKMLKKFRHKQIVDDWIPRLSANIPPNSLILTNLDPVEIHKGMKKYGLAAKVVAYEDVMR